jgi:hypothetical protein
MNSGRYILSQVLDLVDRKTLSRLVERHDAESRSGISAVASNSSVWLLPS